MPTSTDDITKLREAQRSNLGQEERQLLALEQIADTLEAIRANMIASSVSLSSELRGISGSVRSR